MNHSKSLLTYISSMLVFGSIGIFRRYIPVSSGFLAFIRGIIGTVFLLIFISFGKVARGPRPTRRQMLTLVVIGILIGYNWILLFEAFNYTTVATATLCYYMQPMILILLSPLFFGDKLTLRKCLCVLVAIIGMALVSGIHRNGLPQEAEARGILFGLGAAVLYALVVIMNKRLPVIDVYEKTIIQLFSAALSLVPYLILTHGFSLAGCDNRALLMLFIVGLVHTGISYVMYFGSMMGLDTQSIAVFGYIDPVSAMFFSAVFLHESMTVSGLIGAALIIGAAMYNELCGKD